MNTESTCNQEIEAAELATRGLHTCAICRLPNAPADRSVCEKCYPRSFLEEACAGKLSMSEFRNRLLREALTWSVGFIRCNFPTVAGKYPDFLNASSLVEAAPGAIFVGEFVLQRARAELAENERDRFKEALKMIAQIIHGSTRVTCMIAEAALAGANMLDEDTAIDVCEGEWKPSKPG
jgi:hypothetical protein